MDRQEWVSSFVARLAKLHGEAADLEAIRLLALSVHSIYTDTDPLVAAANEMHLFSEIDSDRKLILVADDYDDVAQLLVDLVEQESQYKAVAARDGKEAIVMALRCRPDVALLDIDMPHIDGIEAARTIRGAFRERRPMMIACTGETRADEANLSSQFDHVMLKPIQLPELLALLATV